MNIKTPATEARDIKSVWGEQAWELIKKIKTPKNQVIKKRITLLLLASYRLQGASISHVFKRDDSCSSTIHYEKWMKDEHYLNAYRHLMGIADKEYERVKDELTIDAIVQMERSVLSIQQMTSQAVHTLKEGMSATQFITGFNHDTKSLEIIEEVPDYSERRQAANSILDRVPATAKNKNKDIKSDGKPIQAQIHITLPDNERD